MIPTDKEKVECRNEGCTDRAVAIWSSNIDPEDKCDLCKNFQLKEIGGWPDGVDESANKQRRMEIVVEEVKAKNITD